MLLSQRRLALFILLTAIGAVALIPIVVRLIAVIATFEGNRHATAITEANREIIVAALSLYRADINEYPERLDDLVPAYLTEIPPQLLTPNTGWQYKSTRAKYVFGYLEWPEKQALSSVCSYSSDKPVWYCASGNFEPFGDIPTPYP